MAVTVVCNRFMVPCRGSFLHIHFETWGKDCIPCQESDREKTLSESLSLFVSRAQNKTLIELLFKHTCNEHIFVTRITQNISSSATFQLTLAMSPLPSLCIAALASSVPILALT